MTACKWTTLRGGFAHPSPRHRTCSVSYSVATRHRGMSFLTRPANRARLEACTQAFVNHASPQFIHDGVWDRERVNGYLEQHTAFLRYLLLVTYQTGGQPPRGPEILSIKVCNTPATIRNIFVYEGLICTLIQYNKGQGDNTNPFYVVRFLPALVSQLLYQYLVFIRPFVEHLLAKSHLCGPVQPQYPWPTYHGFDIEPKLTVDEEEDEEDNDDGEIADKEMVYSAEQQGFWNTSSLTNILAESSVDSQLSMTLRVNICRQIVIGIAKEHLRSRRLPSSIKLRNRQLAQAFQGSLLEKLFAWQAGHSLVEDMKTYGLNGAYPTQLQPILIQLYRSLSIMYHDWLGVGRIEESELEETLSPTQSLVEHQQFDSESLPLQEGTQSLLASRSAPPTQQPPRNPIPLDLSIPQHLVSLPSSQSVPPTPQSSPNPIPVGSPMLAITSHTPAPSVPRRRKRSRLPLPSSSPPGLVSPADKIVGSMETILESPVAQKRVLRSQTSLQSLIPIDWSFAVIINTTSSSLANSQTRDDSPGDETGSDDSSFSTYRELEDKPSTKRQQQVDNSLDDEGTLDDSSFTTDSQVEAEPGPKRQRKALLVSSILADARGQSPRRLAKKQLSNDQHAKQYIVCNRQPLQELSTHHNRAYQGRQISGKPRNQH